MSAIKGKKNHIAAHLLAPALRAGEPVADDAEESGEGEEPQGTPEPPLAA
jgi:hypothetical protein